jgi:hypothetical protein
MGKAAGHHIVNGRFTAFSSERDSPPELPEPRLVRSRGEAEVAIREVDVRVGIIRAIEEVEHFESELEVDAFRDGCVFIEINIRLKEVRAPELHRLLIPPLPEGGNGEVALGDRSCQPSLIVRGLMVADSIRVIQILTICVVVAASRRVAHRRICR